MRIGYNNKDEKRILFLRYYEWNIIRWLDFSLIKTDGKFNIKTLVNEYYEFNKNFKNSIKKLIKKTGKSESKSIRNSDEFRYINQKFSELVLKLIKDFRLKNVQK